MRKPLVGKREFNPARVIWIGPGGGSWIVPGEFHQKFNPGKKLPGEFWLGKKGLDYSEGWVPRKARNPGIPPEKKRGKKEGPAF